MTTTLTSPQRFATKTDEEGVIVFDMSEGHLFRMNTIGGQIWTRLNEQASAEMIATEISAEYRVGCAVALEHIRQFASRLRQHSLLSRRHAI